MSDAGFFPQEKKITDFKKFKLQGESLSNSRSKSDIYDLNCLVLFTSVIANIL